MRLHVLRPQPRQSGCHICWQSPTQSALLDTCTKVINATQGFEDLDAEIIPLYNQTLTIADSAQGALVLPLGGAGRAWARPATPHLLRPLLGCPLIPGAAPASQQACWMRWWRPT